MPTTPDDQDSNNDHRLYKYIYLYFKNAVTIYMVIYLLCMSGALVVLNF